MPKSNPENREKLLSLMNTYRVSVDEVATMLGKTNFSVYSWRSASAVDIPTNELQLLEYKLIDKFGHKEI